MLFPPVSWSQETWWKLQVRSLLLQSLPLHKPHQREGVLSTQLEGVLARGEGAWWGEFPQPELGIEGWWAQGTFKSKAEVTSREGDWEGGATSTVYEEGKFQPTFTICANKRLLDGPLHKIVLTVTCAPWCQIAVSY